jgi:hypothetical protein
VGQKTVRFSDLSGEIISRDDALARVVIHEHPGLGDSPVEIEVLADEALAIEKAALRVAVVDLYLPGEDEPHRVTMDGGSFDALATDQPMSELLIRARPARRSSKAKTAKTVRAATVATGAGAGAGAPAIPDRADRVDYASLEHAGQPHRGRITDAEKQLVGEHFDEINERLTGQGLRTISLADPEDVDRYDLAGLARQRGVVPAQD